MTCVNVPPAAGDAGGWFELKPVSALTPDHADDYADLRDELFDRKRAELPPPGPDPDNPAVMAPEQPVKLGRRGVRPLVALLMSMVLEGSSYGLDTDALAKAAATEGPGRADALTAAYLTERAKLNLPTWNVLSNALDAYFGPLQGEGPKETHPAGGTTGDTSSTT